MKKVMDLLKELEELIERGNAVPFSSKAMIDPQEASEIIADIREALPKELAESRKIVAERKQILFEAQENADRMKNDVRKQIKDEIDGSEVVKMANAQAEKLTATAQKQAKEIRVGTQRYADKILYDLQVELKAINDRIEDNRKELKNI